MKNHYTLNCIVFKVFMATFTMLLLNVSAFAQVDVTASGGTPAASYSTLGLAFDAINIGTHTGTITIGISANTSEGYPSGEAHIA